MSTRVTDNDTNGPTTAEATSNAVNNKAPKHKQHTVASFSLSSPAKPAKKSKKNKLVALLSKPNGTRITVIVERLGWQAHTVRAALSGLRKEGVQIATSKSPKTGETVYAVVPQEDDDGVQADVGAVS